MTRYHTAQRVSKCRICGKEMEYGSRVNIQVFYEVGDRRNRKSTSGHVCRECAEIVLIGMKLDKPI